MAIQFSVSVRNAGLDAFETTTGAAAVLRIRSGALPATCATADAGTLLAEMTLPSDWMAAASAGAKSKSGTWEDASANSTGVAGHFRIYDPTGVTCHMQGTVTVAGGGGDMTLVGTATLTAGQPVSVDTFTLTAGNA